MGDAIPNQCLTDEEFEALQNEAHSVEASLNALNRRIATERDRRASIETGYVPGDEIEVESGGYGNRKITVYCITRVAGTSYGASRVLGRMILRDGSLGVKERWIYSKILRKVGHRDLDRTREAH